MVELISLADLPEDFTYPRDLIRLIELGHTDLEPWSILQGEDLQFAVRELAKQYGGRRLIPFARREDSDDVVCFDLDHPSITMVHLFADPAYETRAVYPDFRAWLRQAFSDYIVWDDPLEISNGQILGGYGQGDCSPRSFSSNQNVGRDSLASDST